MAAEKAGSTQGRLVDKEALKNVARPNRAGDWRSRCRRSPVPDCWLGATSSRGKTLEPDLRPDKSQIGWSRRTYDEKKLPLIVVSPIIEGVNTKDVKLFVLIKPKRTTCAHLMLYSKPKSFYFAQYRNNTRARKNKAPNWKQLVARGGERVR